MKKILTILVVAIFLVSMLSFSVFAHRNEADRSDRDGASVDSNVDSSGSDEVNIELDNRQRNEFRGLSEFGRGASDVVSNLDVEVRERHEALRERFVEFKEKFKVSKDAYLKEKTEFRVKVNDAKGACEEDPKSGICEKLREDAFASSKKYILNAVNVIEDLLEKRKAKLIEMRADIEDSELENRDKLLADLDARLDAVNSKLQAIAELRTRADAAETQDEIKAVARVLKNLWKDTKVEVKASGVNVFANKFAFAIHRSAALGKKLDNVVAGLESGGENVGELDKKVDEFKIHVENAQSFVAEAREKFGEESDVSVKESTRLMAEAHTELKLAHRLLKDITLILRELNAEDELEAEFESEKKFEVVAELSVENSA